MTPEIPLRWFIIQRKETHEWGRNTWETLRDYEPVLQYWNGEKWADVPTVKEIINETV